MARLGRPRAAVRRARTPWSANPSAAALLAIALLSSKARASAPGGESVRAGAQETTIALISVLVPGEEPPGFTTRDIEAEVLGFFPERGLRPISEETLFVSGGISPMCVADPACLSRSLAPTKATHALVLVANLVVRPAILSVVLWDAANGVSLGTLVEAAGAEELLTSGLAKRARAVLDKAGFVPLGRILVQAEPRDALIRVSRTDQALQEQVGRGLFRVSPGRWRIDITSAGCDAYSGEVDVESGREVSTSVTLGPKSNALESPWLWTAIGAVTVVVVVGAILIAQPTCVCVFPEEACDC
ncbi:MAG: hypothetical protein HY791_03165 [Deltaproteobacteria bacterium]|nr:hypothetical protein [Deltaproteobacteria bacterium]